MDKQSNNQFIGNGQNSSRRQDNHMKPQGQDRKQIPEKNNFNMRDRNPNNIPGQLKPKEQRPGEKAAPDNQNKENKLEQRFSQQQNRYPRNNPAKPFHDPFSRAIKAKREETVEDIQADAERIEKDIQFEIKQIKSIKLGL